MDWLVDWLVGWLAVWHISHSAWQASCICHRHNMAWQRGEDLVHDGLSTPPTPRVPPTDDEMKINLISFVGYVCWAATVVVVVIAVAVMLLVVMDCCLVVITVMYCLTCNVLVAVIMMWCLMECWWWQLSPIFVVMVLGVTLWCCDDGMQET